MNTLVKGKTTGFGVLATGLVGAGITLGFMLNGAPAKPATQLVVPVAASVTASVTPTPAVVPPTVTTEATSAAPVTSTPISSPAPAPVEPVASAEPTPLFTDRITPPPPSIPAEPQVTPTPKVYIGVPQTTIITVSPHESAVAATPMPKVNS